MNKITIIGAGSVGATIAYAATATALAHEIVLIDINTEKALGEAMDIRQGIPFSNSVNVYAGDYADAKGSDIVILTSGMARKPGQSRLDLAQINVNITKSIISEITRTAPDATYVIVSNPVDILTYTFVKLSGIPENKIIGSGTLLDTARYITSIADHFSINPTSVNAYIMGEHGDSSFGVWSHANIGGVRIDDYEALPGVPAIDRAGTEKYVRESGGIIIKRKGATFHAVAISVCHLCRTLLGGMDTAMTVSTMMHGEYGVDDVCLSVLNKVGNGAVNGKILLPLTDDEVVSLRKSADVLRSLISSLDI